MMELAYQYAGIFDDERRVVRYPVTLVVATPDTNALMHRIHVIQLLKQGRYDDAYTYAGHNAYMRNDFAFHIFTIKCGVLAKSARLLINGTRRLEESCKRFPRIAKRYYQFLAYGYYRLAEIISKDGRHKDANTLLKRADKMMQHRNIN
jgi:hypothetical protein